MASSLALAIPYDLRFSSKTKSERQTSLAFFCCPSNKMLYCLDMELSFLSGNVITGRFYG